MTIPAQVAHFHFGGKIYICKFIFNLFLAIKSFTHFIKKQQIVILILDTFYIFLSSSS